MRYLVTPLLAMLAMLLYSCPVDTEGSEHTATDTGQTAATAGSATDLEVEISGPGAPKAPEPWEPEVPGEGIIGQFIIIYSGDSLSTPLPHQDFKPSQGGLCALAGGITDYEAQIVDYNRTRVLNEGGDPEGIKTDLTNGLLGEHPFIVVDYGGWERPNDPYGDIYVAPYLTMFKALKYTAVGCRNYYWLSPEQWESYRAVNPAGFELLVSAQAGLDGTIPTVGCIEREVQGETWKILSLPLPNLDLEVRAEAMALNWESLAEEQSLGDGPCILLSSGAPGGFYKALEEDTRVTVVIGAPQSKSVFDGYGEISPDGTLILPEVDPGGRSIRVCHLYYFDDGDNLPDMYFLTKWVCADDPERPLPFRRQVAAAVEEHRTAVAEASAGK